MNENEKIEDILNEVSKSENRPKPLRTLKRVDTGKTAEGVQGAYHGKHEAAPSGEYHGKYEAPPAGEYHGKHEAPPSGEYHGRYGTEPEDLSSAGNGYKDAAVHHRTPQIGKNDNSSEGRKKRKTKKDIIVKTVSVIASLAVIISLVLTMPIMWWDKKGVKEKIGLYTYLKRKQPAVGIEGELDKSSDKIELGVNSVALPDDYDDGLDFMEQWIEGQYTVLFLGFDVDSLNTDVMWVCQFDLKGGALNILQIPRDTAVPDFTSSPSTKFNSIYSCGDPQYADVPIQRVVDAVQQNFGIPIDAYITTYITDIPEMVDMVGGIPITLDEPILYEGSGYNANGEYQDAKTIPAGDTVLSGEQAEWFIRFRYGWVEGDIGRMQNQQRFMAAAMKKLIDIKKNEGKAKLKSYIDEVMDRELIATDMMVVDIARLADFCGTLSMENIHVHMLPGEATPNENLYVGTDGKEYSIYSIHKQETIDLLNKYFRPYQNPLTGYGDTAIVEYYTDHHYNNYDDRTNDFETLLDGQSPAQNPNWPK